jgi:hypothetical protein
VAEHRPVTFRLSVCFYFFHRFYFKDALHGKMLHDQKRASLFKSLISRPLALRLSTKWLS